MKPKETINDKGMGLQDADIIEKRTGHGKEKQRCNFFIFCAKRSKNFQRIKRP
jgi:hypothetical protein